LISEYLGGRPLRVLTYPVSDIEELVKVLVKASKLPEYLTEALVLASTYVSPLMVLSEGYIKIIKGLAVGKVTAYGDLSINDWKLHLRIADYTVLDMYETCVTEAIKVINDELSVKEVIKARHERVSKDLKRYWRFKQMKGTEWVFMYYIDMVKLIVESGIDPRNLNPNQAAGLAVVPAINLCKVK